MEDAVSQSYSYILKFESIQGNIIFQSKVCFLLPSPQFIS